MGRFNRVSGRCIYPQIAALQLSFPPCTVSPDELFGIKSPR